MENNTIIMPEWEQLTNIAINWQTGTTYTHDEIAKIMALKPCTQKYYNQMKKAIEELTRSGVRLANIKNVGYKVIMPDEWAIEAERKVKKGGKNLAEAHMMLNHAPLLQMSEDNRNKCLKIHDMIIKQKFMLSGGVTEINLQNKPIRTLNGGI